MKVTLFSDFIEEKWPSMNLYARELGNHLKEGNFPQLEILRYQPRATHFLDNLHGVLKNIPYLRFYGNDLFFSRLYKYGWEAKFHQGEINHVLDHSYGHLLDYLNPTKTIITCHDLIPLILDKTPLGEKKSKYLLMFEKSVRCMIKAAYIIADSESTRNDLVRLLSYPAEKIKVIYFGIDDYFKPMNRSWELLEVERKYNLPKGKRLFHLGVNHPYKNIENILKGFQTVSKKYPGPVFFLKAGEDFRDDQKWLINKLDIAQRIIYLGHPSDQELVALFNLSDVLVFPSLYEGFGLPVVQAFACGTPVVTSNVGSLKEFASDAALTVDPNKPSDIAQAVLTLLANPKLLEEMRMNGFEVAKRFSWARHAQEVYNLYSQLYYELDKESNENTSRQ